MTSPYGILGRALGAGPIGGLKRYLRWFNLTMLQQAIWPLLIAVASAPQVDLEDTPGDWFLLRLAGPVLAVLLAIAYLRQRSGISSSQTLVLSSPHPVIPSIHPVIPSEVEGSLFPHPYPQVPDTGPTGDQRDSSTPLRSGRNDVRDFLRPLFALPGNLRAPAIARQIRYALLALPFVVAALRLLSGPADEATKIIIFGAVNVAAYHLIHFGVVPLSFDDRRQGLFAGAILFGLSWGIYNALMFGLTDDGSWVLGLAAGCVLGWVAAALALAIRSWPGGALTAAAAHYLVVYLVAGFA